MRVEGSSRAKQGECVCVCEALPCQQGDRQRMPVKAPAGGLAVPDAVHSTLLPLLLLTTSLL
jgi:hypothetical protein